MLNVLEGNSPDPLPVSRNCADCLDKLQPEKKERGYHCETLAA